MGHTVYSTFATNAYFFLIVEIQRSFLKVAHLLKGCLSSPRGLLAICCDWENMISHLRPSLTPSLQYFINVSKMWLHECYWHLLNNAWKSLAISSLAFFPQHFEFGLMFSPWALLEFEHLLSMLLKKRRSSLSSPHTACAPMQIHPKSKYSIFLATAYDFQPFWLTLAPCSFFLAEHLVKL